MNSIHIISQHLFIIDAIAAYNEIYDEPLVLFAVDENNVMCGTPTDGGVRCSLIKGFIC